jgi:hypothetical protein
MEAEHCSMGGSDERFAIKSRETWPANEWAITVHSNYTNAYKGRDRKLHKIEELLDREVVKLGGLTRHEVIAIVLYTGPMVRHTQQSSFVDSTKANNLRRGYGALHRIV